LDYPEEMASLRKDAHDLYLFNPDGKASSRLVDAIEETLK
jgi:phosphoketolase